MSAFRSSILSQLGKAAKGLDATFQVGGTVVLNEPIGLVWTDSSGQFTGAHFPGGIR